MSSSEQGGLPVRHPRPLTAAELHHELEKEQEAVVNRLTRELSALRAQHSASVASNASHSSTTSTPSFLIDPNDSNPTHQITGPTHPTPSRRHRSSSSYSNRSVNGLSTTSSLVNVPAAQTPLVGQSQASADRAAAAGGGGGGTTGGGPPSRAPSVSGRSGTSTPARTSTGIDQANTHSTLPHRPSLSGAASYASSTAAMAGTPVAPHTFSGHGSASGASMQHATDTNIARSELEIVKAENENLRQRIRALERALRTRRESDASTAAATAGASANAPSSTARDRSESRPGAVSVGAWAAGTGVAGPRERSESQSTTASGRRGVALLAGEDRDEVVRVGESAQNAGLR